MIFLLSTLFAPVMGMWGNGYQQPNNNIAIGFPTAYGLNTQNNNNWGWGYGGQQQQRIALRCENGGAHIGQCRLDNDAICIALGGSCGVNLACCTTPFSGASNVGKPMTLGEIHSSIHPSVNVYSGAQETFGSIEGTTEWPRTTRKRRTKTTTVAKIEEVTLKPEDSAEYKELQEIMSAHSTTSKPRTRRPKTKKKSMMSRLKPSEETTEIPSHLTILLKQCHSGLRPVGPCQDNDDCPTLHHCQNNQICCYDVFAE